MWLRPFRRRALPLRRPAQYVVATFVAASLAGAALLMLPAASQDPGGTPFVTALFTATSAVCVTGLAVVDTAGHWTLFGEVVILVLIQAGGFGIMTVSSLIAVFLSHRLGLRHRVVAAAETGSLDLGEVRRLVVGVARFSVAVESAVAAVLFLRFLVAHDEPVGRAAYLGVFHAVSAFNNAGFALYTDSLVGFAGDPVVLITIGAAVVVGGLGYPAWVDVARDPRQPQRWSLHAKVTVFATVVLLLVGAVLYSWFEWTNAETLGGRSVGSTALNALFQSATARTAGFNSVDVAALTEPSRLLTEILMFIGGGSGSTAGGIKVTTFALLGWVIWAEVRGDPDVVVFSRRVPGAAQRQALTVALLGVGTVVAATMALMAISDLPREDLFFETISALGTVGLTTGATPLLTGGAELLVVGLMLLGRVGPITLFAALVLRERRRLYRHPEERLLIG
ncbi:MAG: TrkH family potassium uptake protein [Acidimicrobiia bacterium]|nr:TrkH family potassium uptake protein [Acidimicrobiia bacterium]